MKGRWEFDTRKCGETWRDSKNVENTGGLGGEAAGRAAMAGGGGAETKGVDGIWLMESSLSRAPPVL